MNSFSQQLFAGKMYTALTPQWASTVLGLFALLCIPIPFVLMRCDPASSTMAHFLNRRLNLTVSMCRFGPALRAKSKYSPKKQAPVSAELSDPEVLVIGKPSE